MGRKSPSLTLPNPVTGLTTRSRAIWAPRYTPTFPDHESPSWPAQADATFRTCGRGLRETVRKSFHKHMRRDEIGGFKMSPPFYMSLT